MMRVYGVELIEHEDRVVFNYRRDGEFEPVSMAAWKAAIVKGDVAIDVGSYSGLYAIAAAKLGASAIAYEPNPNMFRRLRDNVASNNVSVDCRRKAVSDKTETRDFYTRHNMTSAGRFTFRKDSQQIQVECEPLSELRKVCAIKIDVEGAEIFVLRGALDIIKRDRPLVIAEALKDKERDELTAFMGELGYSYTRADKHNLIFRP